MYTKNIIMSNLIISKLERGHVGLHNISKKKCEDRLTESDP